MQDKKAGPFSIGGILWPGLSKLMEEAGEVCQVIGKLVGTGGETQHWDGTNLRDRLEEEIADVLAACQYVIEHNGLDRGSISARVQKKRTLFEKWHVEQGGDPTHEPQAISQTPGLPRS